MALTCELMGAFMVFFSPTWSPFNKSGSSIYWTTFKNKHAQKTWISWFSLSELVTSKIQGCQHLHFHSPMRSRFSSSSLSHSADSHYWLPCSFSAFSLLPRSALCFFVSSLSFFSFSTSVMRIFFWVRVSSFAGFDALEFRVEYTTVARPPDYSTVTGPHSRLPPAGLPEICDGCVFFTSPAAGRSSVLSGSVGVDSPSVACCSPC